VEECLIKHSSNINSSVAFVALILLPFESNWIAGGPMFTRILLALVLFISYALVTTGCESMNRKQKGAIAGAAAGGAFGGAAKGTKGAVVGAAAGAVAGGLLGAYLDKRQAELAQVVETEKTERGLKVTLKNDLLFDFNKNSLRNDAKQTLAELAAILSKYPKDDLRVAGYTDHIGTVQYNKQLSENRAESVRGFLAEKGVKNEMDAVGMGEIPGQGNNPETVAANRKVEIYIDVEPPAPTTKQ
jgi:outer membrane protein OmpA-like peptidoglycan-associated protein